MTANGALLTEAAARDVRISSRLGVLSRKLEFPGGGLFETRDNDGVDALLEGRSSVLARMEGSWRLTLASLAVVVAGVAWLGYYGVPTGAHWLAMRTPPAVARVITAETLAAMDNRVLLPTHLPAARQSDILGRFQRVARWQPDSRRYLLLFRNAPDIGPNAFALPDGRVVITDQLAEMSRNDEELDGVFAHEMSHVIHAHGLQSVYQASLVPAAIAFVTGDASQAGHIATILPGILLQAAYSRGFEQQADDDANAELRAHGEDPGRLANLLERMEQATCTKGVCLPSWLGSHPQTVARALRLRHGLTH
ncbi:MAG TPA: M48 family metallopeptidase [Rhizomicrobium sp.]|nr:M48 family metallopeptidase [Rhizomicrobium sp.]